jgi:mitochondrial-processing peptidase subunit beta
LNAYTSREHTLYHTLQFEADTSKCVEVLGDMLCNSLYTQGSVDQEKGTISMELEDTNKDLHETLMEAVYDNIYREHMIGRPILGEFENIQNVTSQMVVEFHSRNYFGENIVIVGTGAVRHEELVDMVEKHFG